MYNDLKSRHRTSSKVAAPISWHHSLAASIRSCHRAPDSGGGSANDLKHSANSQGENSVRKVMGLLGYYWVIGSICFCKAWRSRSPPNRAAVAKSEVLQGPFHDWQRNCLFKHTIPSWMIIIPFAKASVTPEDIIISRGLRQCEKCSSQ